MICQHMKDSYNININTYYKFNILLQGVQHLSQINITYKGALCTELITFHICGTQAEPHLKSSTDGKFTLEIQVLSINHLADHWTKYIQIEDQCIQYVNGRIANGQMSNTKQITGCNTLRNKESIRCVTGRM